jgi:hypothetical protein
MKKKDPSERQRPGVKTKHVGAKLAFLEKFLAEYKKLAGGKRADKSARLDQAAGEWAQTFGHGLEFDEQAEVYDPLLGADLDEPSRALWRKTYREVCLDSSVGIPQY